MKKQIIIIVALIASQLISISQNREIRLFEGLAPNEKVHLEESVTPTSNPNVPDRYITNVSDPTITYFSPKRNRYNAAIIVCPGGSYNRLAYDKEGVEVCQWLNKLGITAVLLKYRVPRRNGQDKHLAPLQDAQRATRYVRFNAKKYNVNPDKIGVFGFSAGGHLSAMLSTAYNESFYPRIDSIDDTSTKPNFTVLVYPAYLNATGIQLAPEIKVDANLSPTIIIQTADDSHGESSLAYYYALRNAKANVEMHLYPKGIHGYGLRSTDKLLKTWQKRVDEFLSEILK